MLIGYQRHYLSLRHCHKVVESLRFGLCVTRLEYQRYSVDLWVMAYHGVIEAFVFILRLDRNQTSPVTVKIALQIVEDSETEKIRSFCSDLYVIDGCCIDHREPQMHKEQSANACDCTPLYETQVEVVYSIIDILRPF